MAEKIAVASSAIGVKADVKTGPFLSTHQVISQKDMPVANPCFSFEYHHIPMHHYTYIIYIYIYDCVNVKNLHNRQQQEEGYSI